MQVDEGALVGVLYMLFTVQGNEHDIGLGFKIPEIAWPKSRKTGFAQLN